MGINTVSANTQPNFNGVAGATITAGDLVVNSEAGVFYPASAVLTMSQNNNTTAGPTAISAIANVTTTSNYGNTSQISSYSITQLGNGNIVSLYNGNGTTATTNLTAYTRNIQGAGAVTAFTVTSDTTISYFRVKTVNSSSYVVAWVSGTTLKFAIYTNAGAVVKSATTVSATSITDQTNWDVQALVGGNIVFAWYNSSSGLSYSIYDSSGTAVLATTVSEASSQPRNISILRQSGGGFFLYYLNAAASSYKFSRYNSSGTLQGTLTTVASSVSLSAVGCVDDNIAVEMSNGNVAFYAPNSSGYAFYYVYSSTGSVLASALDVSNSTNNTAFANIIPGMCSTPTGFGVVTTTNGTNRFFNVFDTSGNVVIQRKQATLSSTVGASFTSNAYIRVLSNGASGFTIHEQTPGAGCSPLYSMYLYAFDNNGTQRGSTVVLQTSSGSNSTNMFAITLSDGSLALTYRYSPGVGPFNWGTYAMLRKSIVGVAQTTTAINSTATVYTQGNFTINQNMGFGGYFDNRTATVPGTRGTVVGTNAVLLGLS